MEFFTYLGIFWVIFMTSKLLVTRAVDRVDVEELKEELDNKIRMVVLEPLSAHKTILAYDAETHQFLGQGETKVEMIKNIVTRFPTKIFIIEDEVFSALKSELIPKLKHVQTQ